MALRLGLLLLLATFALPADATSFLIREGEDTAPYSFIPSLVRGNRDTLWAFTAGDPGSLQVFETYLRLDLPEELRGRGAQVAEAELQVYYAFDDLSFGDTPAPPGELRLHRVLEPWEETTATWANRPAYGPVLQAHTGITAFAPLAFDVTGLVREWLDDAAPEYGVALTNPTARLLGMYSLESAVAPELQPTLVIRTVPEGPATLLLGLGALGMRRARPGR